MGDAVAMAAPSAPAATSEDDAPPVDAAPVRADEAGAQAVPPAGAAAAGQASDAAPASAASDALPASVVVRSATELSTAFEAIARAAVADGADAGLVQRAIRAGRDQQLRDFVPGTSMTLRPRTIALFLVEVSRNSASPNAAATELRKGLRDGRFGGVK
ncbi:MAG: hypothetical protein D6798_11240 [Deltaproteobacteria bacterium]|nr:MAG: hypothetical protein D6798_11240 [Deltaproteobacteria bacterium]